MFWILKSVNLALKPAATMLATHYFQSLHVLENSALPSFWMIRAYLRLASLESSSDLAPVTTIFPLAKIRAVVLGSRIRMMTAAKRLGSSFKVSNPVEYKDSGYTHCTPHCGREEQ